jgi:hypothetical protein
MFLVSMNGAEKAPHPGPKPNVGIAIGLAPLLVWRGEGEKRGASAELRACVCPVWHLR